MLGGRTTRTPRLVCLANTTQLYNGRFPFIDRAPAKVLKDILEGVRPSRLDSCKRISSSIWKIIDNCWSSDPRYRPSGTAVASALNALGPSPRGDRTHIAVDRRPRVHKPSTLPVTAYSTESGSKHKLEPRRYTSLDLRQLQEAIPDI